MTTYFNILALIACTCACFAADEAAEADFVAGAHFGSVNDFRPNPDNGKPPEFSIDDRDIPGGKHGIKLVYTGNSWGNLSTPAAFADFVESVSFQIRREAGSPTSQFYLWLMQPGGDGWLSKPTMIKDLKEGWNLVRMSVSDFSFQPRGTKVQDIGSVDHLLIGCNGDPFTATIADLRFEGKGLRKKWEDRMNTITIFRDKSPVASFLGFGAEWDPKFWTMGTFQFAVDPKQVTVTEADWDIVLKRIAWMRLPIVRMMFCPRWCTTGDGVYEWDNVHMKSVYRHLDACQKLGVQVILTDWGSDWWEATTPGFTGVDDPKYAETIGVYLDRLVNEKKYTCIKYFVLMNEPNYSKYSFDAWKRGVLNVIANLKAKKLSDRIAMVGSDESGSDTWHVEAVNQLANELGGYDLHCYTSVESIRSGGVFQLCQRMWGYALGKDPKAAGKPLIIGEAGIVPPGTTGTNPLGLDFNYGMYMTDYATQAANGGSWAMCPWMLEDGSHVTFTWGMWMNKAGNLALKPWFYPWALLSRTFPRGCKILLSSSSDARVLAAEIPGTTPGWTFCLVNYGAECRKILSVAGAGTVKLDRYVYSRAAAKADADGFPSVDATVAGDLAAGLEVELPAESVVFLTTLK